jgi:hypothetical protein
MVRPRGNRPLAVERNGIVMNSIVRVFSIVAGAATLAACGSLGLDFSSGPSRSGVVTALRLESDPPGAEAKTSVGPGCRTPCAVNVPADREFTVSFSLNGYVPATESVKPVLADDARVDIEAPTQPTVELAPNPVFAQLQPAPPPAKQKAKAKPRAQAKQPARAQAPEPAPAPPAAGNWPAPAQSSPAWPAPQSTPR